MWWKIILFFFESSQFWHMWYIHNTPGDTLKKHPIHFLVTAAYSTLFESVDPLRSIHSKISELILLVQWLSGWRLVGGGLSLNLFFVPVSAYFESFKKLVLELLKITLNWHDWCTTKLCQKTLCQKNCVKKNSMIWYRDLPTMHCFQWNILYRLLVMKDTLVIRNLALREILSPMNHMSTCTKYHCGKATVSSLIWYHHLM